MGYLAILVALVLMSPSGQNDLESLQRACYVYVYPMSEGMVVVSHAV